MMQRWRWVLVALFIGVQGWGEGKLVWPSAPDQARFSYVKSITSAEDLEIHPGFWKKVWNYIAGNQHRVLQAPMGLAVAGDGKIYVTDSGQQSVFVFDRKENSYDIIEGYGENRFISLIDIEVDKEGLVYVSDAGAKKVYVLDKHGESLRTIDGPKGGFERPTGIAINHTLKRIYVTDTLKATVEMFTLEGKHIGTVGQVGTGEGEFNRPTYITVGADGKIYVTDSMNHRIQIFDSEGKFLRMFGQLGGNIGDFGSPRGIAVDSDNNIYIADSLLHVMQIFDQSGNLLLVIGQFGANEGEFSSPKDVVIDSNGVVYIADFYNMRVQMIKKLPDPMKAALP